MQLVYSIAQADGQEYINNIHNHFKLVGTTYFVAISVLLELIDKVLKQFKQILLEALVV